MATFLTIQQIITTTSDSDIWLHLMKEEIIFGSKQACSHIPMHVSTSFAIHMWQELGNESSKLELMTDLEICWVKLHINVYVRTSVNSIPNGDDELHVASYLLHSLCLQTCSLMPTPRVPPSEKRSGERSRISWAYSPKWWKTNEIARSLIIT